MSAAKYSYEVETRHGSRWITDCVCKTEHEARKRARELLADPKCAGAHIMRSWNRPDGVTVETEIFCEIREVKDDAPMRIASVEATKGKCESVQDLVGLESRQVMSRIFRDYISRFVLTPTEIIHNYRHLKRIHEKDRLVQSAVEMIATLQATDDGPDARTRRDELYRAVDEMIDRARALEDVSLPELGRKFSDVLGSFGDGLDHGHRKYLMLAALSRELGKRPSWAGKLEYLCAMADAETEAEALAMLDGVIADVLGTDVVEDILGVQPNLGSTICALFDLADGIAPTARSTMRDETASLCALLASGKLPGSRRCIIDRAHRALRLPAPLRNNDREAEPQELRKIIARVVTPAGLHSGPDTALALTTRFSRLFEEGGKTGRRAAIKRVFFAMPDMAYGILYLCDSARSELGRDHLADMEVHLKLVLKTKSIRDLCHRELELNDRMAHCTAAYNAVAASPFAAELKADITFHIDDLLERFVVEENIIEKLDQPGSPLRERAMRLLRFCDSGLLPKGRALKRAHGRAVSLLKQPDFTTRFVAGISDKQAAETALREVFALLKRTEVHTS